MNINTIQRAGADRSALDAPVAMQSGVLNHWPLERVLFALAGTMTLIAAALTLSISKWFVLLAAFVGLNQWLYVSVGACPASIVLRRACKLRSAIYEQDAQRATPREKVTV